MLQESMRASVKERGTVVAAGSLLNTLTVCTLAALATVGCTFSSAPPGNAGFARIANLRELDGCYRNRGQGGDTEPPLFLSALLWSPAEPTLDHASIAAVDVQTTSTSTLTVRAVDGRGVVVHESTFVEGDDFHLDAGRLRITRRGALISQAADDPLVGPRMEVVELGLDLHGQGKYRSTFRGAGLVYLLIPVAVYGAQEVRFERLEHDAPN
jgi:hypothetical protein